ncbi:MAG: aminotransferase class IV [Bacteroidales bacterium]
MAHQRISTYTSIDFTCELSTSVDIPSSGTILYDVIRISHSIPLFWEDHLERFLHSFSLAGITHTYTKDILIHGISAFIQKENIYEGNIKIMYKHTDSPSLYIYQINHLYPTEKMYKEGVQASLLYAERINPNVKQQLELQKTATQEITRKQIYDVILVDSYNNLREGSKTNLFFIDSHNTIHTAHRKDVLPGITRKKIISVAQSLHYPIIERKIPVDDLSVFEAAFFSGTSPKILPIRAIENKQYNVHNTLIQQILKQYNTLIEQYIYEQKN